MDACPLCSGTTGYRNKVLVEYERQRGWENEAEGHFEHQGTYKEYLRRYCMDCNKCVSAALDAPTFKL